MSDSLSLKWGTLKSGHFESDKGRELLRRYHEIGSDFSAMMRRDTAEQREIICEMIDLVDGDVYLDWDERYVSKEEAKRYVLNYGKRRR